jgi:hypothetical protein
MRQRLSHNGEVPEPWIYHIHDPSLPLGSFRDERLPGGDNRGGVRRRNTGRFWTKKEVMQAFEALPVTVRRALANSNHPWAPHWALWAVRDGYPAAAVVARIERADKEQAMRRELKLLRGEG